MTDKLTIQDESVLYTWKTSVHVLSNPSAWSGVSISLGGGALLLALLFCVISKSFKGIYLGAAIFAGLMIIFIVVGGVIDLFGGFRVQFIVSSLGIRSLSGKGAKAAAGAAVVGGILTGNPAAAGAGKLAESEQDVFIPYPEIKRIKVSQRRRYILVKGGWAQKPIGLYCNPDDFSAICDLLRRQCPSAQFDG